MPITLEQDIAFEIGRFYYGIRDYANALHYYSISIETVGDHHVTFHNQGLCHYSLGRMEVALTHFRKALAMNADYEKARSWIEKVQKEMEGNFDQSGLLGREYTAPLAGTFVQELSTASSSSSASASEKPEGAHPPIPSAVSDSGMISPPPAGPAAM